MKRIFVFFLIISMFCITACNSANNDVSTNESKNVSNSGNTTVSADSDEELSSVGEGTTSAQESSDDPHKGWTLVFGDIYIPDLPFSDWGGQNQDNISCYTIFIKSNNSAAFHSYVQSLTEFGYTIEQTESYAYKGTDPENRSMHFTDHENGQMQISIYY